MTGAAPALPLPLRALNRAGDLLRAAGVRPFSLDPEALMARARRNTGLHDFGADLFVEPLRRYTDSLEREAHLTLFGRLLARRDALRLLEGRLRMEDECRRHPEIGEGAVAAPLFVLGLPRTGTSILHELLAQDPANRVPLTWEVMQPWPAPEAATHESDPRIAEVEGHFAGVDRLLPEFRKMHPMGARLPQECAVITAYDFATMVFHTAHDVPSYQKWLDTADLVPFYASHRRWLQYLQWRCPGERWVLKSPAHLWGLEALLRVYPDARIVQCHRDPLQVIASLTSLVSTLRGLASEHIDPFAIGADWTRRLAAGLDHTLDVRERGLLPEGRVYDLRFDDFMQDEVGAVKRIYDHFGMDFSPGAEQRMRRFLAANPRAQHGAHRYALADAGLDEPTERHRYARYSGAVLEK